MQVLGAFLCASKSLSRVIQFVAKPRLETCVEIHNGGDDMARLNSLWWRLIGWLRGHWAKARPWMVLLLMVVVLLVVAWFLYKIFVYSWPIASGFGEFVPTQDNKQKPDTGYLRAKTLWDLLDLLIVPIVLAGVGYFFNRTQQNNTEITADKRATTEREIAEQRSQDAVLDTYLNQMAELLIDKKLRLEPTEEVKNIALIRTLTALRRLDGDRNSILLRFLHDTGLLGRKSPDDPVPKLDMVKAELRGGKLHGANLEGVTLVGANLEKADLEEANLGWTWLATARLKGAILRLANLQWANLEDANLESANLESANLQWASLAKANLERADLGAAFLQHANLKDANLKDANLREANLQEANLEWTNLTEPQLATAFGLWFATMPLGSRYDGRFNLQGDIEKAKYKNIKLDNPAAMADYYGISSEEYRTGQVWALGNLRKLRHNVALK
jgi:pentapeptide repeat protein